MSRLSPSRVLTALTATCALGLALTACGGSNVDPGDAGAAQTSLTPTPTSKTSPTKLPVKTKTPRPTTTASADGGDGDSVGDDEPVTQGGGICGKLTVNDVEGVIGGDVDGSGLSGNGCLFEHADHKAPQATFRDQPYAGMGAAKTDATSAVEGDPETLSGIGRGAFVVTGTIFGGTDVQGAGAVHIGSRTISVLLVQSKGMARAKVRSMVVELLTLAAQKAS